MKAFLAAILALVVITVGANQFLTRVSYSAQSSSISADNVRIDN